MTGIGCGIVRLGSVVCSSWQSFLQERPYATAYWPFSVMESCTSNANPLPSENMECGLPPLFFSDGLCVERAWHGCVVLVISIFRCSENK